MSNAQTVRHTNASFYGISDATSDKIQKSYLKWVARWEDKLGRQAVVEQEELVEYPDVFPTVNSGYTTDSTNSCCDTGDADDCDEDCPAGCDWATTDEAGVDYVSTLRYADERRYSIMNHDGSSTRVELLYDDTVDVTCEDDEGIEFAGFNADRAEAQEIAKAILQLAS